MPKILRNKLKGYELKIKNMKTKTLLNNPTYDLLAHHSMEPGHKQGKLVERTVLGIEKHDETIY